MFIIQTVYIIGAIVAIAACLPQINQLRISKASDELSLPTWSVWLITQATSLLYVTSLGNALLIVVNSIWVTFYLVMVLMIVHYRHIRPLVLKRQALTSDDA